jgi:hypothetical protein
MPSPSRPRRASAFAKRAAGGRSKRFGPEPAPSHGPAGPELDRELRALLGARAAALRAIEPLPRLAVPRRRGDAHRLHFADGRSLKLRRLRDAAAARRVAELLGWVGHPFPGLLARAGRALLLEWVEGHPLGASPLSAAQLRGAARLQAALHVTPPPPRPAAATIDPTARQGRRTRRHLERLRAAGRLDAAQVEDLAAIQRAHAPVACELGLAHGDLCAENLVVDAAGALRSIDNEALSLGPCDADLGRTWYRWPLAPGQRERYLEAYAATRSPEPFLAHFAYWALAALLGSAAHRLGGAPAVADPPLRRLARLMAAIERGAPATRLYREL